MIKVTSNVGQTRASSRCPRFDVWSSTLCIVPLPEIPLS
jgi:hypothetical protein